MENDIDCSDYSMPKSLSDVVKYRSTWIENPTQDYEFILNALRDMIDDANEAKGWRDNYHNLMDIKDNPHLIPIIKKYYIATCLALIHSEISEAMEGNRKDKMDDHLPHRTALEVELADAIIRILDLSGTMKLDIGGAVMEKHRYNQVRADHLKENRAKEGGKKF